MKYLYLIIFALFIAFLESSVGSVLPFGYVSYAIIAGVIIFWLLEQNDAAIFLFISGILIDLISGNWIGTIILSFFTGLLVVAFISTIFNLQSEERRFFGGLLHLILASIFNYFLIILRDNGWSSFSVDFIIYMFILNSIIFSLAWVFVGSTLVKKTSLYR